MLLGLYIPSAEVFSAPSYDVGDNRGHDEDFDPEQTRVAPEVRVSETTTGAIRVEYDAANPFAPSDPTDFHTVDGDVVITPPGAEGDSWRLDGSIGDYPAFEVYHDDPQGNTTVLAQDEADNEGRFGPLLKLPRHHHDVGGGPDSDAVKQFGDLGRPISGPYYEYTPRHGEALGEMDDPTQVDPWPSFGEEQREGTVA